MPTSEFIAYLAMVVGVLIASVVVDGNGNGDNGAGGDYFRADRAWFSIVLLTIGYMVSRGLATSGSRAPLASDSDDGRRLLTGRAAAHVCLPMAHNAEG